MKQCTWIKLCNKIVTPCNKRCNIIIINNYNRIISKLENTSGLIAIFVQFRASRPVAALSPRSARASAQFCLEPPWEMLGSGSMKGGAWNFMQVDKYEVHTFIHLQSILQSSSWDSGLCRTRQFLQFGLRCVQQNRAIQSRVLMCQWQGWQGTCSQSHVEHDRCRWNSLPQILAKFQM